MLPTQIKLPYFLELETIEQVNELGEEYTFVKYSETRDKYIFKLKEIRRNQQCKN